MTVPPKLRRPEWVGIRASVQGFSHRRRNLQNQDAQASYSASDGRAPIIIAVSDGHGSPRCFRSHIGSDIATKVSVRLTLEFLARKAGHSMADLNALIRAELPPAIVDGWRKSISAHIQSCPFSEDELAQLEIDRGASARTELLEGNVFTAYGATLLIAAILDKFALYLQIGDGNIVAIDSTGGLDLPFTEPFSLISNETESLCLPNAAQLFQIKIQDIGDYWPRLIMLSTDGYSDCFETSEGFYRVPTDILQYIERNGATGFEEVLKEALDSASERASGDDITVSLIIRGDFAERRMR